MSPACRCRTYPSPRLDQSSQSKLSIHGDVSTKVKLVNVQDTVAIDLTNGLEVKSGGSLYARADQLHGQTITGDGTVLADINAYYDWHISDGDTSGLQHTATQTAADLSGISADLDLTALTARKLTGRYASYDFAGIKIDADGVFVDGADATKSLTLPGLVIGQTLTVTAEQMEGRLVLAKAATNGGGTINVQGDIDELTGTVDLTDVEDGIDVSFADGINANLKISSGTQATTDVSDLVIKADQVSGLTIVGDGTSATAYNNKAATSSRFEGSAVRLADNDSTTESTVTVDLTDIKANIDVTAVTGLAVTDGKLVGTKVGTLSIGTTADKLAAQQTLLINAGQLDGALALEGAAGSVVDVRGDISLGKSVDLRDIMGSTISFYDAGDSNTITVTGILKLRAEQFDAAGVDPTGVNATGGMVITGTGTLEVYATQAETTVDWVDPSLTPAYYIDTTFASSTLIVEESTTLVAKTGVTEAKASMPTDTFGSMVIQVNDGKTLTSNFVWVDDRTITDTKTNAYTYDPTSKSGSVDGGTLVVTGGTATDMLDLSGVDVGTLDLRQFGSSDFGSTSTLWSDLKDRKLILNDTQADGNAFSVGGIPGAVPDGELIIHLTADETFYDFSNITNDDNIKTTLVVGTNAWDVTTYDEQAESSTVLNVFDEVNLDFTGAGSLDGYLTVSADQVNGMMADRFTGTGGLFIRADGANFNMAPATLYGTSNNDVFVGGWLSNGATNNNVYTGITNTLYLNGVDAGDPSPAGKGGSDKVVFSATSSNNVGGNDFDIFGFTVGTGTGHDILDFSNLSSHLDPNTNGGFKAVQFATAPSELAEKTILLSDSFAADASGVASLFGFGNVLNKGLDRAGNEDAIFIVAASDPNAQNGAELVDWQIWHWVDSQSSGERDGYVDSYELTLLGTLEDMSQTTMLNFGAGNILG